MALPLFSSKDGRRGVDYNATGAKLYNYCSSSVDVVYRSNVGVNTPMKEKSEAAVGCDPSRKKRATPHRGVLFLGIIKCCALVLFLGEKANLN